MIAGSASSRPDDCSAAIELIGGGGTAPNSTGQPTKLERSRSLL